MRTLNMIFISLLFTLIFNSFSYSQDIREELREIKKTMVTREEFKLFVEMVNKRFEDINKRFEDINKRFDDVNGRFEDINKRFEDINRRFEDINKRFEDINKRFEDIHSHLNRVVFIIGALNGLIIIILGVIGLRITKRTKEEQKLIIKDILSEDNFLIEVMERPKLKKFFEQKMKEILSTIQTKSS